jgi:dihydrofolate reductase
VANKRKIIVHIATSADGYIARPDGDLEWLTERPAPKGFYGIGKFMNSIDTKLLGRKTYDLSVQMGAKFDTKTPHYVFSRRPAPASVPAGVEFISESVGAFAKRLRTGKGKDIWMMGGGEIIASFLDEGAIDDFIITVIPLFIGEGTANRSPTSARATPPAVGATVPGRCRPSSLQGATNGRVT